jgi:D-inositol-3-phosphate glycosyltransferase
MILARPDWLKRPETEREAGSSADPPTKWVPEVGADAELEFGATPQPGADAHAAARQLARVGVFWSADGVAGPTESFHSNGRVVAAATWTQALARYGTIPSIDIFSPLNGIDACRQQFAGAPGHVYGDENARARFIAESDLPRQFQSVEYDLLHAPLGLDLTQGSYLRSRYCSRIFPVTCAQHGTSYSFDLHSYFIRLLTAQIYPCDAIVCLTASAREAMRKRLGDVAERYSRAWDRPAPPLPRLELIPWGVDTQLFAPRDQAVARRELNLPPDRPILLCLGRVRIEDKMDWTPLLLAFDRVSRTVKERPLLVLAGASQSEYGDQLVAQAGQMGLRDSVRTFFNLPPASLPSLYAACDVFISPTDSPSESFGLTIVEAMACGRPVVASDWDGSRELIVHGETGFRVRTDWTDCLGELDEMAPFLAWDQQHLHVGQSVSVDVGQMAGYLIQLLENPGRREAMGRQGRQRVEALYDWPVVIGQWEALWAELIAIARSIEQKQPDRLEYLRPHYFQHFSHYASRIINDETPVQLTERGKAQLAGRSSLLLHPRSRGLLHPQYLQAGLTALKPAGWLGASLPVGKVLEAMNKLHGLSRDRALMHLMWLAKYDLITFGEGEPPRNQGSH